MHFLEGTSASIGPAPISEPACASSSVPKASHVAKIELVPKPASAPWNVPKASKVQKVELVAKPTSDAAWMLKSKAGMSKAAASKVSSSLLVAKSSVLKGPAAHVATSPDNRVDVT